MIRLILLLLLSPAGAADLPSPDLVEELRAIHPDAARHLVAGMDAWTSDPERAEGLLREAIRQAPGFAPLAQVGCEFAREQGHRSRAISWCRQALRLSEDPGTLQSLALALSTPAEGLQPTQRELAEAAELAVRATLMSPDDVRVAQSLCEVALHADDGPRLQTCVTRLDALQPDALPTRYYAAHLAAAKGRLWSARRQLDDARASGLSSALYDDALQTFHARRSRGVVQAERTLAALGLWLVAVLWMLGIARLGRRQVVHAVELRSRGPLEAAPAPSAVRAHRDALGALAGMLGLSVVFLLGGLLVAGMGVLRLLATQPLPNWGLAVGVALGLVAACLLLLHLALPEPRVAAEERGFPVDLQSYPALRRLLDAAYEATGAPPVARVLLVPDCTLRVQADAGALEQLTGAPDRLLWLGIGLLPSLSPQQLAALVTCELARDAAEDGVARLRRLLPAALEARRSLPTAAVWNPWWPLLGALERVWERSSAAYGDWATQEADRTAATGPRRGGAVLRAAPRPARRGPMAGPPRLRPDGPPLGPAPAVDLRRGRPERGVAPPRSGPLPPDRGAVGAPNGPDRRSRDGILGLVGLVGAPRHRGRDDPPSADPAQNCSASVDSVRARVDALPAVITWATASK